MRLIPARARNPLSVLYAWHRGCHADLAFGQPPTSFMTAEVILDLGQAEIDGRCGRKDQDAKSINSRNLELIRIADQPESETSIRIGDLGRQHTDDCHSHSEPKARQ